MTVHWVILFSIAMANSNSHFDNVAGNNKTPYALSLRQGNVLFVEDNAGWGPLIHPDSLWLSVLTNLLGSGNFGWFGPTTGPYDDGPDLSTMQNYELVIWNNYDHYENLTLTDNDQLNISNYINGSGKFWLIAQDAIYSGVPFNFLQTNFHLASYVEDYISGALSTRLQGLTEVAGSIFFIMEDYVWNDFNPDALTPDADAHHIIKDTDWNQYPGILSNDSLTSFWAIDGRNPNPYSTWEQLVQDMLLVFNITGIKELPTKKVPLLKLQIMGSPSVFSNSTTINYTVPVSEWIAIKIYNKHGRYVKTLVDKCHSYGSYKVIWDGTYLDGSKVASGVYFCKMTCGAHSCIINLVVLR